MVLDHVNLLVFIYSDSQQRWDRMSTRLMQQSL